MRFGPESLNQLTNDLTFLSLGRKSGYSWQSDLHLFLTQDDEIRFETDGSLRGLRYQYQKWATPENLDDGQWHHFTFVLAGHDAKIYYDGIELPVTTFNPFPLRDELIAGIPQGSAANLGFFYYGQRTPIDRSMGSPRVTLDRVRFYDREITLSEAQALYHHDLDGDGFQDRVEGQADFWTDANGDGIRDFEELRWVMNPFHRDPADADHDGDTLTSWFELNDVIKTSPKKPDTDDDGLPDPWERLFGVDPNTPSPSEGDTDADGLTDLEEYLLGTYPNESDTDGDGQLDGNDPTPTTENDPVEGSDAPAPTFVLIVTTEGTPKAESQEIGYGADFQPLSPQSDGKGLPERSTQKSTLQLKRSSAELPANYLCFRAGDSGEGENKTVLVGVFSFAAGALVSEPIKEVRGPKVVAEEEESTDQPSSGNLALNLLPVEIKVNDTIKEEDDFVAVSKDITDEDLATDFSVKVSAMGGLTADLKVKGADGGIKFKEQTLMLTDGVEAKTKLWGISPSSAKEKTIVEITLKKDGKEIGKIEEDVTVFEGVEVRYEGRTYSNIDTREFGRRPWDGRKDPKPNSKYDPVIKPKAPGDEDLAMYIPGMKGMEVLANIAETNNFDYHSHDYRGHKTLIPDLARYRATVDVDEAYGYASAFSFELNDNKGITSYRPWTDTSLISVKVVGLYTIKPRVEVEDDPLLDKSLSLEDGSLSNVGNNDEFVDDGVEIFRNPIMHIDGELTAKSAGKKTDTGIRGGTELVAGDRFSDTSDPKFDLDISDLNSDVSNYINDSSKPQAQRDLAKVLRANSFVLPKEVIFSWKNDAMEFEKNTNSKSVFTKHIVHQVESKTATYRNRLTWAGLHEASGTSLIIDGKIIKQQ